jgi:hypothetical protein
MRHAPCTAPPPLDCVPMAAQIAVMIMLPDDVLGEAWQVVTRRRIARLIKAFI